MKLSPTLSVAELLAFVMDYLIRALAEWKAAGMTGGDAPESAPVTSEAERCEPAEGGGAGVAVNGLGGAGARRGRLAGDGVATAARPGSAEVGAPAGCLAGQAAAARGFGGMARQAAMTCGDDPTQATRAARLEGAAHSEKSVAATARCSFAYFVTVS